MVNSNVWPLFDYHTSHLHMNQAVLRGHLTLYHTITTINNLEKNPFENIVGKR